MAEKANIQHPTSNIEHRTNSDGNPARKNKAVRQYDLEERLLDYACRVVRLISRIPKTRAGNHVAKQLLRSGTSPLPNHGEAQAAESGKDFVHKLKICLKELRESYRWLRLIDRVPLVRKPDDADAVRALISETQELIRIFYTSVRTTQRTVKQPGTAPD
jgi:four helix bundle protein